MKKTIIHLLAIIAVTVSVFLVFISATATATVSNAAGLAAAVHAQIERAARANLLFAAVDICLYAHHEDAYSGGLISSPTARPRWNYATLDARGTVRGTSSNGTQGWRNREIHDSWLQQLIGRTGGSQGTPNPPPPVWHTNSRINCNADGPAIFSAFVRVLQEGTADERVIRTGNNGYMDVMCHYSGDGRPGLFSRVTTRQEGAAAPRVHAGHCATANAQNNIAVYEFGEARRLTTRRVMFYAPDSYVLHSGVRLNPTQRSNDFIFARDYLRMLYQRFQERNSFARMDVAGNPNHAMRHLYQLSWSAGGYTQARDIWGYRHGATQYLMLMRQFNTACGIADNLIAPADRRLVASAYFGPINVAVPGAPVEGIDFVGLQVEGRYVHRYRWQNNPSARYGRILAENQRGTSNSNTQVDCVHMQTMIGLFAADYARAINSEVTRQLIEQCQSIHSARQATANTAVLNAQNFRNSVGQYRDAIGNLQVGDDGIDADSAAMATVILRFDNIMSFYNAGPDQAVTNMRNAISQIHNNFINNLSHITEGELEQMHAVLVEMREEMNVHRDALAAIRTELDAKNTTNPGPEGTHIFTHDATYGNFVCHDYEFPALDGDLGDWDVVFGGGDGVGGDDGERCEIGALGWILCPVIRLADRMMGGLASMIMDRMEIESGLLVGEAPAPGEIAQPTPTFQVWQHFRNLANVGFVIFFLIVILSQITGIGINNYGIKKMLPNLIVTAVLVNLSYIICQIAVDLSNILGSQLQLLLADMAPEVPAALTTDDNSFFGTAVVAWILAGGIAIGAVILTGHLWAMLAMLIAAVASGLIALLMMFLILEGRIVVILALVALSPIAFLCYALPMTKGLFRKWLTVFKVLLVLYPVCALLIGMGQIFGAVTRISAVSGDETRGWLLIAGAIVTVLPYFAVFSLTRGSLNVLGSVGAKINGIGSRVGSYAGSKASGAAPLARRVDYQKQRRDGMKRHKAGSYGARKAQREVDKLAKKAAGGDLSAGQERRLSTSAGFMAAHQDQAVKDKRAVYQQAPAALTRDVGNFSNSGTTSADAVKKMDSASIVSMLNEAGDTGQQKQVGKILDRFGDMTTEQQTAVANAVMNNSKIMKENPLAKRFAKEAMGNVNSSTGRINTGAMLGGGTMSGLAASAGALSQATREDYRNMDKEVIEQIRVAGGTFNASMVASAMADDSTSASTFGAYTDHALDDSVAKAFTGDHFASMSIDRYTAMTIADPLAMNQNEVHTNMLGALMDPSKNSRIATANKAAYISNMQGGIIFDRDNSVGSRVSSAAVNSDGKFAQFDDAGNIKNWIL